MSMCVSVMVSHRRQMSICASVMKCYQGKWLDVHVCVLHDKSPGLLHDKLPGANGLMSMCASFMISHWGKWLDVHVCVLHDNSLGQMA